MPYWIFVTAVCGGIGFWIANRYRLDGKVGLSLGCAFGILFNGGLYNELLKYDAGTKMLLVLFVSLLCLAFLIVLERRTSIAWMKLVALTLLVSGLSHSVVLARFDYDKVQLALSHAAQDPAGSFRELFETVRTKLAEDPSSQP